MFNDDLLEYLYVTGQLDDVKDEENLTEEESEEDFGKNYQYKNKPFFGR